MTEAKKLKAKARARAEKTGESYAAARRHVVDQLDRERGKRTAATASTARQSTASGAVSNERCVEKTGHDFDYWFAVLDRFKALALGHTAAAKHLREAHDVSPWYAQAITIAYERAKGVRVLGQATSGSFQFSVSRVLRAEFGAVRDHFTEQQRRRGWLDPGSGHLAAALSEQFDHGQIKVGKDFCQLRCRIDGALVVLRVAARDDGRSTISMQHSQLSRKGLIEPLRTQWRSLLDGFKDQVGHSQQGRRNSYA